MTLRRVNLMTLGVLWMMNSMAPVNRASIRPPPLPLTPPARVGLAANDKRPANAFVELKGEKVFKGEWLIKYTLVNHNKTRSIKVKVTTLESTPQQLWPHKRTLYFNLEAGEEEEWGAYGPSTGNFKPEILGAWYSSEAPPEENG